MLRPLDPIPEDVNDWPDFVLLDAKIFYQGKGRYADLLEASEETPLCVVGILTPVDDDQQDLLLRDDYAEFVLKLDDVTNYSFGQNEEDGKPVVWAAGKAGWYEITPSVRYQSHFDDTIEAIDLFYFLVDQHQKLPKFRQKRGFKVDSFLSAYQKHTDYRIDDNDDAMEELHKHHRFLLKQMYEEREGIDWSETHLWKHLAPTYSDEVELLAKSKHEDESMQDATNGVDHEMTDSTDEEDEADEEDESDDKSEAESEEAEDESDDEDGKAQAESSEAEEDSEAQRSPSPEKQAKDWTQPIWEILCAIRISGSISLRHCNIDKLAEQLEQHDAFPGDHDAAMTAIEHAAEPLLALMNQAKLKKKFNWTTRPIYTELEAPLADELAEIKTPARNPDKRHRQKSVLRPSGHGAKANKRALSVLDSADEDDEVLPISTPGNRTPLRKRNGNAQVADSDEDDNASPSRQLNGDINALPVLPAPPETQEMLDLVKQEAKAVGRQKQVSHLEAFLGMNFNFV